jgi:uncharacterized membrane protein YgcG
MDVLITGLTLFRSLKEVLVFKFLTYMDSDIQAQVCEQTCMQVYLCSESSIYPHDLNSYARINSYEYMNSDIHKNVYRNVNRNVNTGMSINTTIVTAATTNNNDNDSIRISRSGSNSDTYVHSHFFESFLLNFYFIKKKKYSKFLFLGWLTLVIASFSTHVFVGRIASAATAATAAASKTSDAAETQAYQLRILEMQNHTRFVRGFLTSLPQIPPTELPSLETASTVCEEAVKFAAGSCLESLSPALQEVIPILSIMGSTIVAAKGTKEKCEKANKGYQIMQGALAAYQTLCASAQVSCKLKCEKAWIQNKKTAEVYNGVCSTGANHDASCQLRSAQIITNGEKVYGAAIQGCSSYQKQLVGAVMATSQIITSMARSQECAEKTSSDGKQSDCSLNPNLPQCVDCMKKEYANSPTCICIQTPTAPGCGEAQSKLVTSPNQIGMGGSENQKEESSSGVSFDRNNAQSSVQSQGNQNSSGAGASGNSSGGGMMGGGLGGAQGSSGVDKSATSTDQKKTLNSNILSGDSGGGGGGYRGGGSYGSLGNTDNPYNRFLPSQGAEKDGSSEKRQLASLKEQITGSGGLSNFEKVKKRYHENKATLLSR